MAYRPSGVERVSWPGIPAFFASFNTVGKELGRLNHRI
jgi:hypothetical protein